MNKSVGILLTYVKGTVTAYSTEYLIGALKGTLVSEDQAIGKMKTPQWKVDAKTKVGGKKQTQPPGGTKSNHTIRCGTSTTNVL